MININKHTKFYLFALFSLALVGCSSSNNSGGGNVGITPTPDMQLTPATTFDFGTITEGNTASPFELTISNNGTSRLDISNISVSDNTNFQIDVTTGTNPCLTTSPAIDTGTSCTVEVSFQPAQTGTFTASLVIESNNPGSPDQVSLSGTSEAVAAVMNVTINQVELAACPQVTAFVSVTDQGSFPIEGLTESDFNILEDLSSVGNPTMSDTVAMVTKPISIALVMDYSSSMTESDIAEMEKSALGIVDQLNGSDKAEIIKFDTNVFSEPPFGQLFTSNKTDLKNAINSELDNSGTALYDAIELAVDHTELQQTDRKAVIVITDGVDNSSTAGLQEIIDNAKAKDVPVFVIGLGNNVDTIILNEITDGTSAEFYEADVAQNLLTIIEQQLTEVLFVDQYVLTYTTSGTGNGTVNLTVEASKVADGLSGSSSRDIPQCP